MTIKTEELINSLAQDSTVVKQLQSPLRLSFYLLGILIIYAVVTGFTIGIREDLLTQLGRPFFIAEISLLLLTIFSSVLAAMFLLFPDGYQKKGVLYWPLYSLCAFILIMAVQVFFPLDSRMVIPTGKVHSMECTICIASITIIPSALMFVLLRKGASVYPFLSGVYAMILSSGVGCLMLRLSEADDSLIHLALWHYIPILLFAVIGAFIGKIFLKW